MELKKKLEGGGRATTKRESLKHTRARAHAKAHAERRFAPRRTVAGTRIALARLSLARARAREGEGHSTPSSSLLLTFSSSPSSLPSSSPTPPPLRCNQSLEMINLGFLFGLETLGRGAARSPPPPTARPAPPRCRHRPLRPTSTASSYLLTTA